MARCSGSFCQSGHNTAIVSFPAFFKSVRHNFFCAAGFAQESWVNLTNFFFSICFHFLTLPKFLQLSPSYHLFTAGWIRACIALANGTALFSVLCAISTTAARVPTECCQGNSKNKWGEVTRYKRAYPRMARKMQVQVAYLKKKRYCTKIGSKKKRRKVSVSLKNTIYCKNGKYITSMITN